MWEEGEGGVQRQGRQEGLCTVWESESEYYWINQMTPFGDLWIKNLEEEKDRWEREREREREIEKLDFLRTLDVMDGMGVAEENCWVY
jgi:hypothetical protein